MKKSTSQLIRYILGIFVFYILPILTIFSLLVFIINKDELSMFLSIVGFSLPFIFIFGVVIWFLFGPGPVNNLHKTFLLPCCRTCSYYEDNHVFNSDVKFCQNEYVKNSFISKFNEKTLNCEKSPCENCSEFVKKSMKYTKYSTFSERYPLYTCCDLYEMYANNVFNKFKRKIKIRNSKDECKDLFNSIKENEDIII